ncbi:Nif11-like leader peptide family natural product precursor [Synechococcus sp. UW105]|uniref:Nif11-like leader peptide family natural product precursor n=1 Tax=Synechococcus sp. UW105 TaxID=337067 RepID=UPI000E0F3768|nr:Nif11-like leader peptide family natural product precursor [Synechococcus sp. UW105]
MSEEQLKAFLEKVKAENSLQEKLKSASDADEVAKIAKDAGFRITADELNKVQQEIPEDQLEGVTGGQGGYANKGIAGATTFWQVKAMFKDEMDEMMG